MQHEKMQSALSCAPPGNFWDTFLLNVPDPGYDQFFRLTWSRDFLTKNAKWLRAGLAELPGFLQRCYLQQGENPDTTWSACWRYPSHLSRCRDAEFAVDVLSSVAGSGAHNATTVIAEVLKSVEIPLLSDMERCASSAIAAKVAESTLLTVGTYAKLYDSERLLRIALWAEHARSPYKHHAIGIMCGRLFLPQHNAVGGRKAVQVGVDSRPEMRAALARWLNLPYDITTSLVPEKVAKYTERLVALTPKIAELRSQSVDLVSAHRLMNA